jgi:putative hydrolase of the HAD superfamily
MKKAVFFDLDNTLYSYDHASEPADRAVQNFCLRQFGIPAAETAAGITDTMNLLIEEMGWKQAATHDRLIRFSRFLQNRSLPSLPYAGMMDELYWDTLIAAAVPEKGAWQLLAYLKEKGYFIGCATNMTSLVQYRKLKKLGMETLIDMLITSEEACTEKPDPEFFRFCAARAGVKPEECVFIGDNYRLDVQGSEAAGMTGIHYQTDDLALRHKRGAAGCRLITDFTDLEQCMSQIEG